MFQDTFASLMHEGGWVMWPLLLASIIAMVAALERALVLRRARIDVLPFLKRLRRALVDQRSPAQAVEIARKEVSPAGRVAEAALEVFERSPAKVERAIERQASLELRRLEKRFGLLSSVVTLSPLLGFLGTVTGMISSFKVLAEAGMSNPSLVAAGISQALMTTAAGLVVAIPAQMILNVYTARVNNITADLERVGGFLLELRENEG